MRRRVPMLGGLLWLCFALATSGVALAGPPELGPWAREGIVFSDVSVHNLDVLPLGGGQLRAYFMQSGMVRSATSTDEGDTFAIDAGDRLAGSHPAVVELGDGSLRMYYVSADPLDGGAVLSATSADGLVFAPELGVRLSPGAAGSPDEGGIIHLDVISLAAGGYRMYYDAVGPGDPADGPDWRGIRSATSPDGLTWTKEEGFRVRAGKKPIEFADLVWSPFVERGPRRYRYKLYFGLETPKRIAKKRAGIYLATSRNGLDFTIHADDRVLGMDPAVEPAYGDGGMLGLPQDPCVAKVTGGKRLFYWQAEQGTFSAFLAS